MQEQAVLDALWDQHARLDEHFTALSDRRETPIFALEHGLQGPTLDAINSLVCSAVSDRLLPGDRWLPFVVYAAELGYRYEGDEYWHTFEERTPRWNFYGDRNFIRRCFEKFAAEYSGVRPGGAWAQQFTIISWPITHAVLPTDLQRHLARLLFEYRYSLDAEMLQDPTRLGDELASYAWNASGRFQHFAENTELLGQVAAALLTSDEEADEEFLEPATLYRIVEDLNRERQARVWLQTAKRQASEVRLRRFDHAPRPESTGTTRPPIFDPKVSLIESDGRWKLNLEFPDLSPLAVRLPDVGRELRDHRVEVGGSSGRFLPRAQLLYPRQRVALEDWPCADAPLLRVENGSDVVKALLADQARFLPGPPWLFRVNTPGSAIGMKGKSAHVGGRYLLGLSSETTAEANWITRVESATSGIALYDVLVPRSVTTTHVEVLESLGLSVVAHIDARPVGAVPAAWDSAEAIEWILGSEMILGVWCDRSPVDCTVTIADDVQVVGWPAGEDTLFLRLSELEVGTHLVQLAVYAAGGGMPLETVDISVTVRSPEQLREGGDPREGLSIYSDPARPTIAEIWDRQAVLEVFGPSDVRVDVAVALVQRSGHKLFSKALALPLPISAADWARAFQENVRQSRDAERRYDEADAIEIVVAHDRLGRVGLTCEREFRPLRWIFRSGGDATKAKLIDLTDQKATAVQVTPFDRPCRHEPVSIDVEGEFELEQGGLLTARGRAASAVAILPPVIRNLGDMGRLVVDPRFPRFEASLGGVETLITTAAAWSSAESPGTFAAETVRVFVTNAIAAEMACLIGGDRWRNVERRVANVGNRVRLNELVTAVGDRTEERQIAAQVRNAIWEMVDASPRDRITIFGRALTLGGFRSPGGATEFNTAEVLLRLVSEPGSLATWPREQLRAVVRSALAFPAAARAARLAIVCIELDKNEDLLGDLRLLWQ